MTERGSEPPKHHHPQAELIDEIRKRDWTKVHIEGDRRQPVLLTLYRWMERGLVRGRRG
jgi:hypothetical protein